MTRSLPKLLGSALVLVLLVACNKSPPPPAPPPEVSVSESEVEPTEVAETSEQEPAEVVAEQTEPAETPSPADATASLTGTLKVRFEYGTDPPVREVLKTPQDAGFCGTHNLQDERLIVHPENKGIKNVVVYVYTGRGGSELAETPPRNATVTFANQNCRFEPHIGLAQVGDTLRVTNPDPVGHNFNLNFFNNKAQNLIIPPGEEKTLQVELSEPAPIPIDCNIHPWMKGYVVVLDHPYVGLSDDNGELMIEGLPVGEKLVFRAFHEAGALREVVIGGESVEWSRSRFEHEVKSGVNDLGTVVVPADSLSP